MSPTAPTLRGMSGTVDLDALAAHVRELGPAAYLVSVGDGPAPHVVSVEARFEDGALRAMVGRHTAANLAQRPAATVVWPPAGGDHSLIVDGTATVDRDGGVVAVRPTRAVLHRVAGAPAEVPSCIALERS